MAARSILDIVDDRVLIVLAPREQGDPSGFVPYVIFVRTEISCIEGFAGIATSGVPMDNHASAREKGKGGEDEVFRA